MKQDTKKIIITVGVAITGYHVLSMGISQLPAIPMITTPLFGSISVLTVAAAAAVYGAFVLWTEY